MFTFMHQHTSEIKLFTSEHGRLLVKQTISISLHKRLH